MAYKTIELSIPYETVDAIVAEVLSDSIRGLREDIARLEERQKREELAPHHQEDLKDHREDLAAMLIVGRYYGAKIPDPDTEE